MGCEGPFSDVPLAVVWRGGILESVHRGRWAACEANGRLLDFAGDPEAPAYLRSSAKPLQTLPLVLAGAVDDFQLTEEQLAVICASHNGEARQLAAVRSVLGKAGLSEKDLQNGAHPPLYAPAAAALAESGESPQPIHGNCSGKHAGMLALCAHEGWDLRGYRSPGHPLQREILKAVAEVCGVERDAVETAGDNCGVPTFALPLRSIATGFARLATGELPGELAEAALRIRAAMRKHPFMVAGTGRLDTELMQATRLVCKGGAEALFAAGSPEGWGLALKISDGANRAVRPAALAALSRRGVATGMPQEAAAHDLHGKTIGSVSPFPR